MDIVKKSIIHKDRWEKMFKSIQKIDENILLFYINEEKLINLELLELKNSKPSKFFKKKYLSWEKQYNELKKEQKRIKNKIMQIIDEKKLNY